MESSVPPFVLIIGFKNQLTPTIKNPEIVDTGKGEDAQIVSGQLEEGCGGDAQPTSKTDKSLIAIFIAGLLGGLVALVTPCVFPMIPMTVSFFTKRSGSRRKGIMLCRSLEFMSH